MDLKLKPQSKLRTDKVLSYPLQIPLFWNHIRRVGLKVLLKTKGADPLSAQKRRALKWVSAQSRETSTPNQLNMFLHNVQKKHGLGDTSDIFRYPIYIYIYQIIVYSFSTLPHQPFNTLTLKGGVFPQLAGGGSKICLSLPRPRRLSKGRRHRSKRKWQCQQLKSIALDAVVM